MVFERLLLCWKGLKIVILNEAPLCHLCHSSEACPCEGMLPLRRQGQGAPNPRPLVREWIPNQVWNDKSRRFEILRFAQNDPASNAGLNELDAGFGLRTRLRRTGKSGMTIALRMTCGRLRMTPRQTRG